MALMHQFKCGGALVVWERLDKLFGLQEGICKKCGTTARPAVGVYQAGGWACASSNFLFTH